MTLNLLKEAKRLALNLVQKLYRGKRITLAGFFRRLIFVSILPLLAMDFAAGFYYLFDQLGHLRRDAHRLSYNTSLKISSYLNIRLAALSILAASPMVDHPDDWEKLYQEAVEFYKTLGTHVVFADSAMQMLFNTRVPFGQALPPLPRPSGRAGAPLAIETQAPQVGDAFFGPIARELLVSIAVPVVRGNQVPYLFLTTLDGRTIQNLLAAIEIFPDTRILIQDSAGTVIAERTAQREESIYREDWIPFTYKIPNTPWTISVKVHNWSFLSIFYSILLLTTAGILLSILLSLTIGKWVGRKAILEMRSLIPGSTIQTKLRIKEIDQYKRIFTRLFKKQKESEQRYYNLIEGLPIGVATIDEQMRILMANRQLKTWFSASADPSHPFCYEVLATPPRESVCDGCPVVLALQSKQSVTVEREVTLDDGVHIFKVVAIPMVNELNQQNYVIELHEDITEAKKAEQYRIQKEASDHASQMKSQFLSSMSHEIRTPLNAILGFASLLEKDPTLQDNHREKIRIVGRSSTHLLNLINDILDISRIESGKIEVVPSIVNIYQLLEDLHTQFRSRATAKNLNFNFEVSDDIPIWGTTDELKLRQIFTNIIGNAVKFTEKGGVAVRIRKKWESPSNFIILEAEVQDTGPGIQPEELEKLFQPFQQGAAGVKSGGTGLGLAITKKLIELLGGKITVRSEAGKGCCINFHVKLEVVEQWQIEKHQKSGRKMPIALASATGEIRVLIVDDVEENRKYLLALLQPLGFIVQEAINGEEAISHFTLWRPHIVLMDMRMPVMNGYEATRRIKAEPTGKNTPIVAVTASPFRDSEHDIFSAGADGFIRKPFLPEDILEIIRKHLNIEYAFSESIESKKQIDVERTEIVKPEDLESVPSEVVQLLTEALEIGDTMGFVEIVKKDLEPKNNALAQTLIRMVQRYDYDGIRRMIWKK